MSTHRKVHGKRSFTGNHPLLPAMRPAPPPFIPKVPTYTFLKWTFGRGSVIWKIWPAVLLHTLFACAIVYIWIATKRTINVPNVMLTVMGVVIGFVISYRAMSGYDRYWMGRTAWTDVIRNARTMGRLIWYHVPARLTPLAPGETTANSTRSTQERAKVMAEKKMALDLVEAFAVALKHHLRGELGIYYEDLYDLVRPLHDFTDPANPRPTVASAVPVPPAPAVAPSAPPPSSLASSTTAVASGSTLLKVSTSTHAAKRPTSASTAPDTSASASGAAIDAHSNSTSQTSIPVLLPASNPAPEDGVLRRVQPDVIPFAGVFTGLGRWVKGIVASKKDLGRHRHRGKDRSSRIRTWSGPIHPQGVAQLEEYEKGENLPEEVLRCLSEWISVLEERGTVPGTSLGSILGGLQTFEISLSTLEHILTTPLPFVYSVHIRHVVWLYLFLLPLQLVNDFEWHTVPAVMVGAFVYLGFVAAGEEIEQPFGYDDNDLDLDMFCREIIRSDIQCLKNAPCLNAWFPPKPASASVFIDHASSGDGHENGHGNGNGSLLSPETVMPVGASVGALGASLAAGTSLGGGLHAYGGNMYRASLASLSDTASLEVSEEEDEEVTETETETEAEVETAEGRVEEGELVDVR
ncbi:Bestrophin, RFP-TM, chloride channel-domain-containing protein [Mycena capillaripes]|nr:Bestrophin, RFP-TM, chloride channel-domain-containing protein [Mycena capillaripes]